METLSPGDACAATGVQTQGSLLELFDGLATKPAPACDKSRHHLPVHIADSIHTFVHSTRGISFQGPSRYCRKVAKQAKGPCHIHSPTGYRSAAQDTIKIQVIQVGVFSELGSVLRVECSGRTCIVPTWRTTASARFARGKHTLRTGYPSGNERFEQQ